MYAVQIRLKRPSLSLFITLCPSLSHSLIFPLSLSLSLLKSCIILWCCMDRLSLLLSKGENSEKADYQIRIFWLLIEYPPPIPHLNPVSLRFSSSNLENVKRVKGGQTDILSHNRHIGFSRENSTLNRKLCTPV